MMDAEGTVGAPPEPPQAAQPVKNAALSSPSNVALEPNGTAHTYTEEKVVEMVRSLNLPACANGGQASAEYANAYLTNFQKDPSAWSICISILNKHSHRQHHQEPPSSWFHSVELLHFVAQTLAAQARAGFPQQLSALLRAQGASAVSAASGGAISVEAASQVYAELRDGLLHLVFAFRDAPVPALRQLCIALSSALIFGASAAEGAATAASRMGDGGLHLGPVLQALGQKAGKDGFLPLLELLVLLPEELCTKRIALPEDRRLPCLASCISNNSLQVMDTVEAIFVQAQTALEAGGPEERPRWLSVLHSAVRAMQSWLSAICCWVQQVDTEQGSQHMQQQQQQYGPWGLSASLEALSLCLQRLSGGRIFAALLCGVIAEDSETLQLSTECVVAIIAAASLLEESTAAAGAAAKNGSGQGFREDPMKRSAVEGRGGKDAVTRSLIAAIVKAYGDGCTAALAAARGQARGIAAFDLDRLQVFALGLTELAKVQIPRLLVDLAEEEARLEEGEAGIREGEADMAVSLSLQPAIEAICELPRTLLQHPSLEVKEVGVAFYRNLLNHVVVLVEEERRLSAWRDHLRNEAAAAACGVTGAAQAAGSKKSPAEALAEVERRYERNIDALALREPVLSRIFQPFAEAAVPQLRPPVEALLREEIEFEAWQNFRSEVAATVTEAAVLLDIDRPCSASARQLLVLLKDPEASLLDLFYHPMHAALLDVEARLYFVSAIANRIRLNVPQGGTQGDSNGSSINPAAPSTDPRNDDFLLQLLPLLPQVALLTLPNDSSAPPEKITEREALALFLHAAAARAVSWLAGRVLPQHQELFAPLFSLLVTRALQFVASLPEVAKDSNAALLRLPGLSLDNSSSLVHTAGYVISCLDAPRIRVLFAQLLQSLGSEVDRSLSDPGCPSSVVKRNLGLFFSAVQSVQPAEDYAPPPPSQTFEPLSPRSPYRHPVLDAVETAWPTIEKAMTQGPRGEFLYEASCYALVALCANCRAHMPRYRVFYSFLHTLCLTFVQCPTVYHLGSLRSLQGIFSNAQEECVRRAVAAALEGCVGATLEKIKAEGERYMYSNPDIVGISVDCVNVALLHPLSAEAIASSPWFVDLCVAAIQHTPTCNHPKVLHTFIVFLSRIAAWVDPPSILHSYQVGEPIPWLTKVAEETSAAVLSLLSRPFPRDPFSAVKLEQQQTTFLEKAIAAVLIALTSVHAAPQSWIGSAAQTLLPLLRHPILQAPTKKALENTLQSLDSNIMDEQRKRDFCWRCTGLLSVRDMCLLLQQTADDTKASYVRSQFALGGASSEV
ncbi:hypothetical protein, conserved [Eimeria brunetti]|uniref:Exportin-1/Importin-beta-like domain-containing protein n=1 Tax=Eimeria brunetti TaxID=51314 RepID=U6LBN8_9EIME|nr:hypothetical protein, conserved [Eimeria brunetti]